MPFKYRKVTLLTTCIGRFPAGNVFVKLESLMGCTLWGLNTKIYMGGSDPSRPKVIQDI